MPDLRRSTVLAVLLSCAAACAGNHDAAPGPEAGPTAKAPEVPMPAASSLKQLVNDAAARVLSDAPAGEPWPVLLSVGAGSAAAAAADDLRAALGSDPRVRFTKVEDAPAAPVPDTSTPGGHVHPVDTVFTPPPRLVVGVWEFRGQITVAAREPGADPLGPPVAGWLWLLTGPAGQ